MAGTSIRMIFVASPTQEVVQPVSMRMVPTMKIDRPIRRRVFMKFPPEHALWFKAAKVRNRFFLVTLLRLREWAGVPRLRRHSRVWTKQHLPTKSVKETLGSLKETLYGVDVKSLRPHTAR